MRAGSNWRAFFVRKTLFEAARRFNRRLHEDRRFKGYQKTLRRHRARQKWDRAFDALRLNE